MSRYTNPNFETLRFPDGREQTVNDLTGLEEVTAELNRLLDERDELRAAPTGLTLSEVSARAIDDFIQGTDETFGLVGYSNFHAILKARNELREALAKKETTK